VPGEDVDRVFGFRTRKRSPLHSVAHAARRAARLGANAARSRLTVALGAPTPTQIAAVLAGALAAGAADWSV